MHTEENHTNVLCVKTQSSTYSKKNINLNSDDVWECIYTVKKHHSSYSMKKKTFNLRRHQKMHTDEKPYKYVCKKSKCFLFIIKGLMVQVLLDD